MNNTLYLYKDINNIIFKESGIYKITNFINNKSYIGSGSSKNGVQKRLVHHKYTLISNTHCNKFLQRAFNKYGIENFTIELLEATNKLNTLEKEQYYFDTLKPEYNILEVAGSPKGKKHSMETKKKMSEKRQLFYDTNPDKRKEMSFIKKGTVFTKEHREAMSKAKIGKALNSKCYINSSKTNRVPILQLSKENILIKEWDSITEACKSLGIKNQNVNAVLKGINKTCGNFKWKYKNK